MDEAPENASTEPADQPASAGPPPQDSPRDRFKQMAADRQSDDDAPEVDLWSGSYSHLAMIGTWIGGGVATIAAVVIALVTGLGGAGWLWLLGLVAAMWVGFAAWYGYRRLSVSYQLTDQRLVHESGLLWRTIDRVELIDVDDVTYRQGPMERLLGVGSIDIVSSDRTSPELVLPGIENVREVADKIDDARRKERRSRGLHIESV